MDLMSLDSSFADHFLELKHLNALITSVLHKNWTDDLEFTWAQNAMLVGLTLTLQCRSSFKSATPFCKGSNGLIFEKELDVALKYAISKAGLYLEHFEDSTSVLRELFVHLKSSFLSYPQKISVSYITLLYCLKFYISGNYEIVLQLTSWFLQNTKGYFLEQHILFTLDSEVQTLPFIHSDICCWKRSSSDVVYLFEILSSICFLIKNDYFSVISLMQYNHSNVNNELLSIGLYIQAVSYYKVENYDKAIELLYNSLFYDSNEFLSVNAHLLLSLAFSKKGKHYISIQMLKSVLRFDPSCHVAVIFLSHQYRLLHLKDSEFHSLNLLHEMTTNYSAPKNTPPTLIYNFIHPIFISTIVITSPQVLLYLTHLQLELKKYEMAIYYFESLTASSLKLTDLILFKEDFIYSFGITGLKNLYIKMVSYFLKSYKFSDATKLCQKIIKSMSSEVKDDILKELFVNEICIYKAEGLCGLMEYDDACTTISYTVLCLENCIKYKSDAKGRNDVFCFGKKRSCSNSLDKDQEKKIDYCLRLLSNAYCIKSRVLIKLGKFQEALHFSRLGSQICPGDLSKALDLSLALNHAGREIESALMWLKLRGLSNLDEIHIQCMIDQKLKELMQAGDDERNFLDRDVESLRILNLQN